IDEEKVFRLIEERHPRGIVVNAPGGLQAQTRALTEKMREKYGVSCLLVGDSCFAICDTVDEEVEKLDADMALHIGHNAAVSMVGDYTYLIDATDDVSFDGVIEKVIPQLRSMKYERIGIVTFSQHLQELKPARMKFEAAGFQVFLGKRNNLLLESQVFGCDFSTAYPIRNEVDAFCFLGESEFHAVGLTLSTGKPTFMLDPYQDEVVDMGEAAEARRKRAILSVYKALDAKVFGVITGLRSEEHTSELQSRFDLVCRLLLEKKKK